jgi:F-type H+-transporting ATPase subunit alpha
LRLDLAQYRELEAFAAFGSDLDAASKAQIERGARLVELLKQPQYSPYPVEQQVVSIWLGTTGKLDAVPIPDVRRFEREFLDHVARHHEGIYAAILETGKLDDSTVESLEEAVSQFSGEFQTKEGGSIEFGKDPAAEELDEDQRSEESIKRYVPPAASSSKG